MIESLFRLLMDKQYSLTLPELRHHFDPMPIRQRRLLLDELQATIAREVEDAKLQAYFFGLQQAIKDYYVQSDRRDGCVRETGEQYDAMFNLKDKVLFETALAGAIYENKALFVESVNKVASKIADLLEASLFNDPVIAALANGELLAKNFYKHISSMDCCDFYNMHMSRPQRTPIPKEEVPMFREWVLKSLRDPDNHNLDEKLFLIHIYTGFISRPDRMGLEDVKDIPASLLVTEDNKTTAIDVLIKHKYAGRPGAFNAKGRAASRRARTKESGDPLLSTESDNPPNNIAGIVPGRGVKAAKAIDLSTLPSEIVRLLALADPKYKRTSCGIFQPCYVEEKGVPRTDEHFFDKAFYKHRLPLVAGASGGAGTFEIAMALTPDLTSDDVRRVRYYIMSMYIRYGFHSLHEICFIQQIFGLDYQMGDYKSVMPKDLIGEKNYETLQKEFAHLLGLPYQGSQMFEVAPKETAGHDGASASFRATVSKLKPHHSFSGRVNWSAKHFQPIPPIEDCKSEMKCKTVSRPESQ